MKLERVSVVGQDGLKGWTGDARLQGLDVFAGPNGAGKSTRLLAVLAGLRGLAESPADGVREYLGPALPLGTVDLAFDQVRISRGLADSPRTAAAKKADALVEQLVGRHVVRWDLGDFATATPSSRQQLLDRVCDLAAGGWTVERLVDELDTDNPLSRELTERLARETRPDAWLQAAVGWARAEYTTANSAKRTRTAEADALLNEPDPDVSISPVELGEQLEQLRAQERELTAQLQSARAAERRARDLEADRREYERLSAELAELGEATDGPTAAELADAGNAAGAATEAHRAAHRALADAQRARQQAEATLRARQQARSTPCVQCGHPDPLGYSIGIQEAQAALDEATEVCDDAELEEAAALGEARAARTRLTERKESQRATTRRAALDERLAGLRDRIEEGAPDRVDTTTLETELTQVRLRSQELGVQRDKAVRASERERMVQLAIAARDEAVERFGHITRMGKTLKALKARVTEEAFRPLEVEANHIVEPVLGGRVIFRSGADFGLDRDGAYVAWWSLSDGERAVVGAGISYAFARLAGAPWRAVLLDGAEAVDADRLEALLAGLAARVRCGDLDNALVAVRCDAPPVVPPSVQVHWLGTGES